jgi:two-component system, OmpR family, sensor histidine kinase BaeS
MFKTLRTQLLASILIPILVIVPVVAWLLIYLLQTQVILASIANELIRQAVLVADLSASTLEIWQDPAEAQAFVARLSPRLSAKLMLLDPTGHLLVSSDPKDAVLVGKAYQMPDLQQLLSQETPVNVRYKNSQIEDVTVPVVTSSGNLIGYVRLTNPLANLYFRSAQLGRIALIVATGGILGGLLLGWLLSRSLERPLKKTSLAVYGLANGQLPLTPLNEEGPEEVKVLVRSFNTLMDKLSTSEEARKRLLANTVHELGRPLGALLSALQALRSGADEQTDLRKELLKGMESEVVLLQHLLDDLAHLEQGTSALVLHRQTIQVSEWLPTFLSTWNEAAQENKLSWEQDVPPDLPPATFDPDRIAQALGNLLSNAIRYTPSGGKVKVSAAREGQALVFLVQDSGPGISPEEQENIFQPLYRGKTAKRFSEGMGLGLPIARDLVQAHKGSLTVQSTPGQGSQFKVSLPLE